MPWQQVKMYWCPLNLIKQLLPLPDTINWVKEKCTHILTINYLPFLSERPLLQSTYCGRSADDRVHQIHLHCRGIMNTKALEGEFHSKYIKSLCSALLVLYRCIFSHMLQSESRFLSDLHVSHVTIRRDRKNEKSSHGWSFSGKTGTLKLIKTKIGTTQLECKR